MRRLHLGCGTNFLPEWENHDIDWDITEPLPCGDNEIDAIFAEHVVEHVTSPEALRFLDECYRVLKPGGVLRISVPSVVRIAGKSTPAYQKFVHEKGFASTPTREAASRAIVTHHGHLSAWTIALLETFCDLAGFKDIHSTESYKSQYSEMRTANESAPNSHWQVVGREFDKLETITVEARK